ncbi:hypothetical protein DFH09DRAFT_1083465 [Mycena vulgaris]|nr:hypothetical protein DFH09DRAFT_1083465 [Mycena vulgaris]
MEHLRARPIPPVRFARVDFQKAEWTREESAEGRVAVPRLFRGRDGRKAASAILESVTVEVQPRALAAPESGANSCGRDHGCCRVSRSRVRGDQVAFANALRFPRTTTSSPPKKQGQRKGLRPAPSSSHRKGPPKASVATTASSPATGTSQAAGPLSSVHPFLKRMGHIEDKPLNGCVAVEDVRSIMKNVATVAMGAASLRRALELENNVCVNTQLIGFAAETAEAPRAPAHPTNAQTVASIIAASNKHAENTVVMGAALNNLISRTRKLETASATAPAVTTLQARVESQGRSPMPLPPTMRELLNNNGKRGHDGEENNNAVAKRLQLAVIAQLFIYPAPPPAPAFASPAFVAAPPTAAYPVPPLPPRRRHRWSRTRLRVVLLASRLTPLDNSGAKIMGFSSSHDLVVSPTGKNDTVRPFVGLVDAGQTRRREAKESRGEAQVWEGSPRPLFIPDVPAGELVQPTIIIPPAIPPSPRKRPRKARRQSLPAALPPPNRRCFGSTINLAPWSLPFSYLGLTRECSHWRRAEARTGSGHAQQHLGTNGCCRRHAGISSRRWTQPAVFRGRVLWLFKIVANENGVLTTVMNAYTQHYALVIRPEGETLSGNACSKISSLLEFSYLRSAVTHI